MRKLFFWVIAALVVFTACKNESNTEDTPAQRNLAAARTVADAFRTGDVSKIDSVVAADFTDHRPGMDVVGKDSLKAMITMYKTMFKEAKMEVISEASDSNYVFQWFHFSGIPGQPDAKMIELTRFKDGKAVEHWTYGDWAEAVKMMTASQPQESKK